MIDVLEIRPGRRIRMKDGEVLTVKGAYMATEGVMVTAKAHPHQFGERNCKLEDIVEILPKGDGANGA